MKLFIGWDPREQRAYDLAEASAIKNSFFMLRPFPVKLEELRGVYTRTHEIKDGRLWCPISQAPMATQFAISRFAVPWLANKGWPNAISPHRWVLFTDCDVLFCEDPVNIITGLEPGKAVYVVKHEWLPQEGIKMDNQLQLAYKRKNWSSVMLWDMHHQSNKKLTLEMLNTLPGRDLHALCWLSDDEIGSLDQRWNQLVGVHDNVDPMRGGILHYTTGGPWFEDSKTDWDEYWLNEERALLGGPRHTPAEACCHQQQ